MTASSKPAGRPPLPRVVAIGASAGGLKAVSSLLEYLPADTSMAFVVISHLMHAQKSILAELLSKTTLMPVTPISARSARIQPNHVYVIAPDMELSIRGHFLRSKPLDSPEHPGKLVDKFFSALAHDRKDNAIGVVLSGTGNDGSQGVVTIKSQGGLTFAQDEASADFAEMPLNAKIYADFVLSPPEIAKQLARIAGRPGTLGRSPLVSPAKTTGSFDHILGLVREASDVDFRRYKSGTICRRIAHRMALRNIQSVPSYVQLLEKDREEALALSNDLLITVTEFFRDAGDFEYLQQKIIPKILRRKPEGEYARVWVPGCASGEEAYSLAMCFAEATDITPPPVRIFATDISTPCIAKARHGLFPESIAANISQERLANFFVSEGQGYRIKKMIRDLCIFGVQNVIADAPFSHMDLVSCRNLLIYLNSQAQKEVLRRLHYALKSDGFLFIGSAESLSAEPELFEIVEKPYRIYSRLPVATQVNFALKWKAPEVNARRSIRVSR